MQVLCMSVTKHIKKSIHCTYLLKEIVVIFLIATINPILYQFNWKLTRLRSYILYSWRGALGGKRHPGFPMWALHPSVFLLYCCVQFNWWPLQHLELFLQATRISPYKVTFRVLSQTSSLQLGHRKTWPVNKGSFGAVRMELRIVACTQLDAPFYASQRKGKQVLKLLGP